ncbi:MAG: beta-propeller domain-containing protein [Desulfococcaceae bacterium]
MSGIIRFSVKFAAGTLLLIILCIFAGCGAQSNTEIGNPEVSFSSVLAMGSDAEMEGFLRDQYSSDIKNDEIPPIYSGGTADAGGLPASPDVSGVNLGNSAAGGSYSGKMVQTHGSYFYIAGDRKIVSVSKETANTVSSLDVSGEIISLYLHSTTLAVLFRPDKGFSESTGYAYQDSSKDCTGILLADVSQPGYPERMKEIQIEGRFAASFVKDGKLCTVLHYLPEVLVSLGSTETVITEADRQEVLENAQENLDMMEKDEMIPYYALMDDLGQPILTVPLLNYAQVYRPEIPTGGMITTVTVLDLADIFRPIDSVALIADIRAVYTSSSAIYLAGPADVQVQESDDAAQTAIHKVGIRENLPVFTAFLTVTGNLDGLSAFSESKGILRFTGSLPGSSSLSLSCMQTDAGTLEILSETAFAVPVNSPGIRFTEDRMIVHSREYPGSLMAADLGDPLHPQDGQWINLQGTSDHILPFGAGEILVFGKQADKVQISLLDISDVRTPVLVRQEIAGQNMQIPDAPFSIGLEPYQRVIALPLDVNSSKTESATVPEASAQDMSQTGEGTLPLRMVNVYRVTADRELETLGQIFPIYEKSQTQGTGYDWIRIQFMENKVYIFQPGGMSAADAENPENSAMHIVY